MVLGGEQLLEVFCPQSPNDPESSKIVVHHAITSIKDRYTKITVLVVGELFQNVSALTNVVREESGLNRFESVGSNERIEVGDVIPEDAASEIADACKT